MKDLIKLPFLIILWAISRLWRIISSFFVRFIYKEDQVFLYNGPWNFTLYRVTHVPIFGNPSFNIIHLHTFNGVDEVYDDIQYAWNCIFLEHYQIRRFLQRIPYEEYEPIEKRIQKTEQQISSLLKNAAANSDHPSEFLPGMILWNEKDYVYQMYEPKEDPGSWLVVRISLNESLPLLEEKYCTNYEDDDKPDYVVIPESVLNQIIRIGKERHDMLQKELLAIKDRYKKTERQKTPDPFIIYPWGIYG